MVSNTMIKLQAQTFIFLLVYSKVHMGVTYAYIMGRKQGFVLIMRFIIIKLALCYILRKIHSVGPVSLKGLGKTDLCRSCCVHAKKDSRHPDISP